MFKGNNKNIATKSVKSFWYLYFELWAFFIPLSIVSFVEFQQVNVCWEHYQCSTKTQIQFLWEVVSDCHTVQKKKFSINDFFSKCDQICRKLRIWSHLLKKLLMENFVFCAVSVFLVFIGNVAVNDWWSIRFGWAKAVVRYLLSGIIQQSSNFTKRALPQNHGHNILRIFDFWSKFLFTTSDTEHDY